MESAKRGSSGESTARPDGQRLRPQPPVLDLTATEVAGAPPAASAETEPSVASNAPTEAGPPAPADRSDSPTPPESPGPAASPTPETAGNRQPPPTSADSDGPALRDERKAGPQSQPVQSPAEPEGVDTAAPNSARRGSTVALAALVGAAAGVLGALGILWMVGFGTGRDNRADDAARVGRVEAQVREFAARPPPAQNVPSELIARVAAGEEALQNVKELQARLAQAEAALRSLPAAADPQVGQRVASLDVVAQQLDQSVTDLRRRLDEIAANAQAARDAAMQSAGSSTTAAATAASEVESVTKRVQALETAAQTLQAAVAGARAPQADNAARFAAAALALRIPLERGEPFAPELAALQALTRDPAPLGPLQAFAATGLPSAEALARELSTLIADQPRATEPATGDGGGILERVQQAATKLVRIRPVDAPAQEAPGQSTPGAMFASLKAAAARGDIGGALAEAGKLPEAQRARLSPWMARAQARTAAVEAARAVVREALGALGAAASEPARR